MKKGQVTIFVIVGVLLVSAILLTVFVINNSEGKLGNPAEEKCSEGGGVWREFSNGCVDSCELERNPEIISCTQALTFGCDCGFDECWDFENENCEEN